MCLQPCNPAVGGPAKSQLVHEVDALGGEMGKMADRTYVQKRVLNMSKVGMFLSGSHADSWVILADSGTHGTGPCRLGAQGPDRQG